MFELKNVLRPDQNLTDDQLKKAIETLIDRLAMKLLTPAQQKEFALKKEAIVNRLFLSLTSKDKNITLNDFKEEGLFNKLFINLTTTLLVEKQFNKQFMDEFIKKLKAINPEFDPKKINKPEDLKNFFTKDQLAKLLTPEIMKVLNDFSKEAHKTLTPFSTKPELVKRKTDAMVKHDDPYTNLFGLICSHTAGGYQAVVQHNWGNAYNLPDWNPHHGTSFIDAANRLDTSRDDPLGLEAAAATEFLGEGDDLVEYLTNMLRVKPPTLTLE